MSSRHLPPSPPPLPAPPHLPHTGASSPLAPSRTLAPRASPPCLDPAPVLLPDSAPVLLVRNLPPRPSEPASDYLPSPPTPLPLPPPPPSRFSINSLTRAATQHVKLHARSPSLVSLADSLERSLPPLPSTAAPQHQRSASASALSSLFAPAADMTAKSSKSFFGFMAKDTAPPRPLPQTTDLIDEFGGINFSALLASYRQPPEGTPGTPAEALQCTAEGRLEELVGTATDLLNRVYSAYRARTATLADALGELDIAKEEAANSRTRTENLKAQLDRQTDACEAYSLKVAALEEELAQERDFRQRAADDRERRRFQRGKRASAASDSGFESDADTESCFSREDTCAATMDDGASTVSTISASGPAGPRLSVTSATPPPLAMVGDASSPTSPTLLSAPPKRGPTPLRDSWSSDGTQSQSPVSTTGSSKWSLFSRKTQPNEDVRTENRVLRARVVELEGAVDAALEAVHGRFVAIG